MKLGIDFGTTRIVVASADRGNYPLVSFENSGDSFDWFPDMVALRAADPSYDRPIETRFGWDAWNADRDQDLTTQEAAKTAASGSVPNSNNPAWGDLDANGNWYNVPGQGYVWSPAEAASGKRGNCIA